MELSLIKEFLSFIGEVDSHDLLWWNKDLEFSINANDLFFWGLADNVEINTKDDIELLKRCLLETNETIFGDLYCCRKRKMRPQGSYYNLLDKKFWKKFDDCGVERETGLGNPPRKEIQCLKN